jgi:hypothetical protein
MSAHPLVGAWRYVDALMDGRSARPGGKGIIYYAPSGDMVCQVSPGNIAKAGAKPTPDVRRSYRFDSNDRIVLGNNQELVWERVK